MGRCKGLHGHRRYAQNDLPPPPSTHTCWVCHLDDEFVGDPSVALQLVQTVLSRPFVRTALTLGLAAAVLGCLSLPTVVTAAGTTDTLDVGGSQWGWVLAAGVSAVVVLLVVAMALQVALLPDNTIKTTSEMLECLTIRETPPVSARLAEILSRAIQLQTVSYDRHDPRESGYADLLRMHTLLEESFPAVHNSPSMTREIVGEYSLLYTWRGTDPTAQPIIFCAHLDVVPAEGNELKEWTHPPFAGTIDPNGVVWGRGAIDNKHNVLTQLYAADHLIATGAMPAPKRTMYFCFGHDEEINGVDGARLIAALLKSRGVRAEFVLDEGAFAVANMLPGLERPVALICNCEKGLVDLKLTVDCHPPAHSSSPPGETNVGILARAINRLEARPFPVDTRFMVTGLHSIATALPLVHRVVLANMWFFRPIIRRVVAADPQVAATARTTTAVTVVRVGEKINQIAGSAVAYVNHRILPSAAGAEPDRPPEAMRDEVLRYNRAVIADPRVKVELVPDSWLAPSPVSATDSRAYQLIRQAVHDIHGGEALSAPFLMTGNTDTRWYWEVADNIYRFTPMVMDRADLKMFHGIDERVPASKLPTLARFYEHVIRSVDSWDVSSKTASDNKKHV